MDPASGRSRSNALGQHDGLRYHVESTYAYQGQDLTFARIYSRVAGAMIPRTMRVTALSAHQLVLVEVWENANTHYFTTQTFSR